MFDLTDSSRLLIMYAIVSHTLGFCDISSLIVDGKTLRKSVFASFTKSDIFRCAGLCVMHSVCKSFNLNTKSRTCYLSFKDSTDTGNIQPNADYIQSDISKWPKSVGGPCSDHTCHPTTFCAVIRSSTNTVCRPVQFMDVEEDTSTYYVFPNNRMAWEPAKTDCLDRGGILSIVEGAAENTFLENTALACGYTTKLLWFGATDGAVEGTWMWIDGKPMVYTSWMLGQPNDPGNQDCAGFVIGSGWKSNPCGYSFFYICEMKM
ncbi:CD209 antigen-like [Haliotis cracherodii]|uniref:CD209 antigen-like n=1 Tax=Haliotis cracherodii TaxID=6455 RepID=UPI0039E89F1B